MTKTFLTAALLCALAAPAAAQCPPGVLTYDETLQHYAADIDATSHLYTAQGSAVEALHQTIARLAGTAVPPGTPTADRLTVFIEDDYDTVVLYAFTAQGCAMANGIVPTGVWSQVSGLVGIAPTEVKPKANLPRRDGA